jgi:hypothetical protein
VDKASRRNCREESKNGLLHFEIRREAKRKNEKSFLQKLMNEMSFSEPLCGGIGSSKKNVS